MFRAVKDIIETLKMELGKINILDQNPNIYANVLNFDIPKIVIQITEDKIDVNVNEVLYSPEDLNVITASFNNSIELNDIEPFNMNSISLKNLNIGNYKGFTIYSEELIEKNVHIKAHSIYNYQKFEIFSNKINQPRVVSDNSIAEIWKITIKKEKFMKKEKVLSALEKLLKNYKGRVEKLKFIGYFKNVPLGRAKKIIVVDENLVVFLKRKGKNLKADVVVVKSPEKIMIEVVH